MGGGVTNGTQALQIVAVDLHDPAISAVWLDLLDHYAQDPMGGGEGLSAYAKAHLVGELKDLPTFHAALARVGNEAVGLINCFAGFSTFAARPLLNIHDIVVRAERRGQGIGQALLGWAEQRAAALGCCKLTLEVLSNNGRALASYERAGFVPYVLDPRAGHARLMQKPLKETQR
jgi:ribosomal protein S18 acetylase RimI-like enzyme